MQYTPVEIAQIQINPQLRITLREHRGSIPHHEYLVEAYENGYWARKDKSYIKNVDTDLIERWSHKLISSDEIKKLLQS